MIPGVRDARNQLILDQRPLIRGRKVQDERQKLGGLAVARVATRRRIQEGPVQRGGKALRFVCVEVRLAGLVQNHGGLADEAVKIGIAAGGGDGNRRAYGIPSGAHFAPVAKPPDHQTRYQPLPNMTPMALRPDRHCGVRS